MSDQRFQDAINRYQQYYDKKETEAQELERQQFEKQQNMWGSLYTGLGIYNQINEAKLKYPAIKIQEMYDSETGIPKYKYKYKDASGLDKYLPGGDDFDPVGAFKHDVGRLIKPLEERSEYTQFRTKDIKEQKEYIKKLFTDKKITLPDDVDEKKAVDSIINTLNNSDVESRADLIDILKKVETQSESYPDISKEVIKDIVNDGAGTLEKIKADTYSPGVDRDIVPYDEWLEQQPADVDSGQVDVADVDSGQVDDPLFKPEMSDSEIARLQANADKAIKDQAIKEQALEKQRLWEGQDEPWQETEAGGFGVDPDPGGKVEDLFVPKTKDIAPDYAKQLDAGTAIKDKPLSDLDKALQDLENLEAPDVIETDSASESALYASAAPYTDAPMDVSAENIVPETPVQSKTPKISALEHATTGYNLYKTGSTLMDDNATAEDKALATLQGGKLLADFATKKAGETTVNQISNKAIVDLLAGKSGKEALKLTGKQAVGAGIGGAIGAYTMVTEGVDTAKSWEEKDYDEAILHGIGSVGGGLQAAGAGMMLTGVGAPVGAVLFGVGTAASVISGVGQMIETAVEGSAERGRIQSEHDEEQKKNRKKQLYRNYINSIHDARRY